MAGIPPLALERLAKLRRVLDAARAQGEGLQDQVEQANLGLEMSTRAHRRRVVVGEGGRAYEQVVRETTSRPEGSAEYVMESSATLVRVPAFDAQALAIHDAKRELADAMASRREALEKAAALRAAVDGVEQALRARGWREGTATGEGLLRDPNAGPRVVDAARAPAPGMFSRGAR